MDTFVATQGVAPHLIHNIYSFFKLVLKKCKVPSPQSPFPNPQFPIPYPINNSRVRSERICHNIVWIFRHNPEKELGDENRLNGCHEYGGYRLLRADCITRGFVHTHIIQRAKWGLRRSGSPGGDINGDCHRLFDSGFNASRCHEVVTG